MEMRTCKKCLATKPLTSEYFPPTKVHWFTKICRECTYKRWNSWNRDNKHKLKETRKKYYNNNKQKWKKYADNLSEETKQNIKKAKNKLDKEKRQSNSLYKLKKQIKSLVYNYTIGKGFLKSTKTFEIVGCTAEELQRYLQQTAIKHYGFFNKNTPYHIDHIIPIASAKTQEEVLKLNHYSNLQYLTPEDNLRKGAKIN